MRQRKAESALAPQLFLRGSDNNNRVTSLNHPRSANPGWWSFDASTLRLVLEGAGLPHYAIELRRITSSACMLDVIFEVKRHVWATTEVIAGLITAFQDLFDPQVTLCADGRDRTLDPAAHLTTRIQ